MPVRRILKASTCWQSEGRSTVRFILDLNPSGLMNVIDGLITETMQSEVSQLQELKTVFEEA